MLFFIQNQPFHQIRAPFPGSPQCLLQTPPADRFVVVPPEGADPGTQTPYRPFWAFEGYALTASNDQQLVNNQEPVFLASYTYLGQMFPIAGFAKSVSPLDVVLAEEEQNFDSNIEVEFPLQYLRFFRFRPYPDGAPDFALESIGIKYGP